MRPAIARPSRTWRGVGVGQGQKGEERLYNKAYKRKKPGVPTTSSTYYLHTCLWDFLGFLGAILVFRKHFNDAFHLSRETRNGKKKRDKKI
jgi:hypothetical protein